MRRCEHHGGLSHKHKVCECGKPATTQLRCTGEWVCSRCAFLPAGVGEIPARSGVSQLDLENRTYRTLYELTPQVNRAFSAWLQRRGLMHEYAGYHRI